MKVDSQFGLHPHSHQDFAPDPMMEITGEQSPHNSPPDDYGNFDFNAQTDAMYTRPFQPPFSAPQDLHPLNTNTSTLWPSQITNRREPASPPVNLPIHRSIAPVAQSIPGPAPPPPPPPPAPTKSSGSLSTSRRTLSDDDRRRMCSYHDEHPTVKQTEIGGSLPTLINAIQSLTFLSYVWCGAEVSVIKDIKDESQLTIIQYRFEGPA